jgi:hypothetical protein
VVQRVGQRASDDTKSVSSVLYCRVISVISMMKLMLITVLGLALQQPPAQPSLRVLEGIVVRDDTGEPIRNARLNGFKLLTGAERGRAAGSGTLPPNLNAITDAVGRFVLRGLEPVAYGFTVYADGYARKSFGVCLADSCSANFYPNAARDRSSISLLPLSALGNLKVGLMPGGNISGRVRDQNGRPLAGVTVQLVIPTFDLYRG